MQGYIADSFAELLEFRLALLYARLAHRCWRLARPQKEIAAIKVALPQVVQTILLRAIQVHGAFGTTSQIPLFGMFMSGVVLGLADGPTEAHKINLARHVLKGYQPGHPVWPTEFLSRRLEAAKEKYGDLVETVPSVP